MGSGSPPGSSQCPSEGRGWREESLGKAPGLLLARGLWLQPRCAEQVERAGLGVPRCPGNHAAPRHRAGLALGCDRAGRTQPGCWDRSCSALTVLLLTKACGHQVTAAAAALVLQGAGLREVPRNRIQLLCTHPLCLCPGFQAVSPPPYIPGFSLCCLSRPVLLLWSSGEMQRALSFPCLPTHRERQWVCAGAPGTCPCPRAPVGCGGCTEMAQDMLQEPVLCDEAQRCDQHGATASAEEPSCPGEPMEANQGWRHKSDLAHCSMNMWRC